MARHDGRAPCSYLMDPKCNFVPDPAKLGYGSGREKHALCFTCTDPQGVMRELVVTPTGLGFDLLGERRRLDLAGH